MHQAYKVLSDTFVQSQKAVSQEVIWQYFIIVFNISSFKTLHWQTGGGKIADHQSIIISLRSSTTETIV